MSPTSGELTELDFLEAIGHLDRHVDLEKSKATAGRVEGLSLDKMRRIVEVLGDPHLAYPVLHLTGTNGKGSTARILTSLLRAHGLGVGTYTSPHLESITERIGYDGRPIAEAEFGRIIGELAHLEPVFEVTPSYFELVTAAAFRYFAEQAVDVAVIEVGLLGRFDATNVVEADVAIVTNVGRDHTDGAGDWRRKVAEEKAGIIEPTSHVVLGVTDPELVAVFESEGGREYWQRDRDFGVEANRIALGGRLIDVRTPAGTLEELFLPLHGEHQADNAAQAIAAAEAFLGRALDPEVVGLALREVELPGRFEVVGHHPLLVLDSAHNPDGARASARTLRDEFPGPDRLTLVIGLLDGRDETEMLAAYAGQGPVDVVVCRPDSPRAMDPARVAAAARALGCGAVEVEGVSDALQYARDASTDSDAVLVTGSFYVVGEARTACRDLGLLAPERRAD